MNSVELEVRDEQAARAVPEDIALLYSWAQMQGAKYRDFSATRREERAQILDRASQMQREMLAERECPPAVVNTGPLSADLELPTATFAPPTTNIEPGTEISESRTTDIKQQSTNTDMLSALDRVLAQKSPQPVREPQPVRDLADERIDSAQIDSVAQPLIAQTPAIQTPAIQSEAAKTALVAEQAAPTIPSSSSPLLRPLAESEMPTTSYGKAMSNSISNAIARVLAQNAERAAALQSAATQNQVIQPEPVQLETVQPEQAALSEAPTTVAVQSEIPVVASAVEDSSPEERLVAEPIIGDQIVGDQVVGERTAEVETAPVEVVAAVEESRTEVAVDREVVKNSEVAGDPVVEREVRHANPAWLDASPLLASAPTPQFIPQAPPSILPAPLSAQSLPQQQSWVPPLIAQTPPLEAAQDTRQRAAGNWSALEGIFGPIDSPQEGADRSDERRTPVLAVFSLAGGVGKTNLVATLGRALSAQGQTALLADTTSRGLLPFYFGARGLRPGEVRTLDAKSGSALSLAVYDAAPCSAEAQQQALAAAILRDAQSAQRVLLDLTTGVSWLIRRLANQRLTVLVPMGCDMNSVISLHAVEKLFEGVLDWNGQPLRPFYLLSQFDESLALDRDVREVLRRQLGDRLLQRTIQRTPAVKEALASGMTVVDYAPTAPVSREFAELAFWLRSVSPAAAGVASAGREA